MCFGNNDKQANMNHGIGITETYTTFSFVNRPRLTE